MQIPESPQKSNEKGSAAPVSTNLTETEKTADILAVLEEIKDEDLSTWQRRNLQKLATRLSVPANGKSSDIIANIQNLLEKYHSNDNVPTANENDDVNEAPAVESEPPEVQEKTSPIEMSLFCTVCREGFNSESPATIILVDGDRYINRKEERYELVNLIKKSNGKKRPATAEDNLVCDKCFDTCKNKRKRDTVVEKPTNLFKRAKYDTTLEHVVEQMDFAMKGLDAMRNIIQSAKQPQE
ncbi:hypothetical protein HK098_004963 [Nowakowskiella sp. JEL0407]|nr:hypothetical protein HK098_004963 [Nowakowskiella sp. JEL0407]